MMLKYKISNTINRKKINSDASNKNNKNKDKVYVITNTASNIEL